MQLYLEEMDITSNVLVDQMDWECWPANDKVEDFGITVDNGDSEGF
jgi:hypothetical protein